MHIYIYYTCIYIYIYIYIIVPGPDKFSNSAFSCLKEGPCRLLHRSVTVWFKGSDVQTVHARILQVSKSQHHCDM